MEMGAFRRDPRFWPLRARRRRRCRRRAALRNIESPALDPPADAIQSFSQVCQVLQRSAELRLGTDTGERLPRLTKQSGLQTRDGMQYVSLKRVES